MVSATLFLPVYPTPCTTCSLVSRVPHDTICACRQRCARRPFPSRFSSPRSPSLSRSRRFASLLRRRSQGCHEEPFFLSFQCPQVFFMRTSGPAITDLLHGLHGFAASGSLCPSISPRPQGPSRSRRRRGAVRAHAILAISTVEPMPQCCQRASAESIAGRRVAVCGLSRQGCCYAAASAWKH